MTDSALKERKIYIADRLRRLERSFPLGMSFDADAERQFQRSYSVRYLIHIRIALFLGLLSILTSGVIELFVVDFHSRLYTWLLRAVSLSILAVGWWYTQKPRENSQRVIFWASLLLSWIALEFARINEPPYKHLYYSSLLYVQIFAFSLARLQLKWAVPCSFLIFCLGNYYVLVLDNLILQDRLIVLFMLVAGSIVSVTVCYLLERAVRISYLQRELLGLENEFLQENNLHLRGELLVDGLTQITNRRGFDDAVIAACKYAALNSSPLSLILFDVDYFKQYNDSYGHQAGDHCLQQIASVPKSMVRSEGDLVARYGGEEFVVVLSGAGADDAKLFAEEMRERVLELNIPHKKSTVAEVVTISCGVVSLIPNMSMSHYELIQHADTALYDAKRAGRNRVVCSISTGKKEAPSKKLA